MPNSHSYDVIVVGAGPAGLNAALFLGRARRTVLLCDDGHPRNAKAAAVHGFLTRDGINPQDLQRFGRAEVESYGVEFHVGTVTAAARLPRTAAPAGSVSTRSAALPVFEVELASGERCVCRKLLLTPGVRDILPATPGAAEYYGRGIYHCPYCDGWEHRDQHLVAYGRGASAVGLGLSLLNWSKEVTVCTDGVVLPTAQGRRARRNGLPVREQRIVEFEGTSGDHPYLQRLRFEDGPDLSCAAVFFNTGQFQRSDLPRALGCTVENGKGRTRGRQRTGVPGLFLAGDAAGEVQFAVVAAGEGATAAVAINRELQQEDRGE